MICLQNNLINYSKDDHCISTCINEMEMSFIVTEKIVTVLIILYAMVFSFFFFLQIGNNLSVLSICLFY